MERESWAMLAPVQLESHPYGRVLTRLLPLPKSTWLAGLVCEPQHEVLRLNYARAGRRLGSELVELLPEEAVMIGNSGLPMPQGWPVHGLGRSLLLQATLPVLPDASTRVRVVTELFRTGDNAEREALLRSLDTLPEPREHLELAVEACRSHVQSVFEAIACDNTYPARHFPDSSFNQLVMKAFFTGAPVRRIVELESRLNPELQRMAQDFASERRAAGRTVPEDLLWVTTGSHGAEL